MKKLFSDIEQKVAQNQNKWSVTSMLASAWEDWLGCSAAREPQREQRTPWMSTVTLDFPKADTAVNWENRADLYEEDSNFWNNIIYAFRWQI